MALKNLFDMAKADKYTADGREALIKAQEAETEDKVYQIGEISQTTGLQKTANGWVKPKNGKQPGAKKETPEEFIKKAKEKQRAKTEARLKEEQAKPQKAIESARQNFEEYKKENPDWQNKSEEEIYRELGKKAREAESKPAAANKTTVRQGPNTKTLNETPAEHIKKNWDYYGGRSSQGDMEELVLGPSGYKETDSYSVMGGGKRVQYSKEGAENIVLFYDENGELDDYEIEAAPKTQTRAAGSVSARRMMKDLDGNFWSRPEDFKEDITSRGWDVDEMTNEYAVISNERGSQYEVRFDDHSDDGDLTMKTYKALQIDEDDDDDSLEDAAPKIRQLTGDTRIRVRKA